MLKTLLESIRGPSLRSQYLAAIAPTHPPGEAPGVVTDGDLAAMPPLVQAWLRRVGVVGRPRVREMRARFHGLFRGSPEASWMPFRSEQVNRYDPPSRVFIMDAKMHGVPFTALHRFVGASATMVVRAASLVDVVNARGPEMNQGETVTLFNDLCVLAPGALVDAAVQWAPVDARTVEATYTHAGNTIRARLSFDAAGDLVGFLSHDRFQSADGKTYRRLPWSTPLRDHRDFGGVRIPAYGEAIWLAPEGDIAYGRFDLDAVTYNDAR